MQHNAVDGFFAKAAALFFFGYDEARGLTKKKNR